MAVAVLLLFALSAVASAQTEIGTGAVKIAGARDAQLRVAEGIPRLQGPISTSFRIPTHLVNASGATITDLTSVFGNRTVLVRGTLSGTGICDQSAGGNAGGPPAPPTCTASGAIDLDPVAPGHPLVTPPLAQPGPYVVDHLRLTDDQGHDILPATRAFVPITVLDRIVVTSVTSRPLSLQELQDRGVLIDANNFSAYEFTFGLATQSGRVPIPVDVAFPKPGLPDIGGEMTLPPLVPGLDVPSFDVHGFFFKAPLDVDGVQIPPIPGVIVIPGNIAYLHQFFQVVVLVSNVAPAGSELVITTANAKLTLPLGNNGVKQFFTTPSDDPLWPAKTAQAPLDPSPCSQPLQDLRLCALVSGHSSDGTNAPTSDGSFGPGGQPPSHGSVVSA